MLIVVGLGLAENTPKAERGFTERRSVGRGSWVVNAVACLEAAYVGFVITVVFEPGAARRTGGKVGIVRAETFLGTTLALVTASSM